MSQPIPASHLDLFDGQTQAVLSTLSADGTPQSTLVHCALEDGVAKIVVPCYSREALNLQANPRMALLLVDPGNTSRYIEIRGEAERIETGSCLTARIRVAKITLDAIHKS